MNMRLDGWLVHYNYFKPHESLKGRTPAEAAGITDADKNRMDVVRNAESRHQAGDDGDGGAKPTGERLYLRHPKGKGKRKRGKAKATGVRRDPATALTSVRM